MSDSPSKNTQDRASLLKNQIQPFSKPEEHSAPHETASRSNTLDTRDYKKKNTAISRPREILEAGQPIYIIKGADRDCLPSSMPLRAILEVHASPDGDASQQADIRLKTTFNGVLQASLHLPLSQDTAQSAATLESAETGAVLSRFHLLCKLSLLRRKTNTLLSSPGIGTKPERTRGRDLVAAYTAHLVNLFWPSPEQDDTTHRPGLSLSLSQIFGLSFLCWMTYLICQFTAHPPHEGIVPGLALLPLILNLVNGFGLRSGNPLQRFGLALHDGLLISATVSLPFMLWLWLAFPLFPTPQATPTFLNPLILGFGGVFLGTFLLISIDIRSQQLSDDLQVHEQMHNELGNILNELSQVNTEVAAGHFATSLMPPASSKAVNCIQFADHCPEHWLRWIDERLATKASVASLEGVIHSRQRHLVELIERDKEQRQRAQSTVLAAGGAMVGGYVTFEVGSSVMDYGTMRHTAENQGYFEWISNQIAALMSRSSPADDQTLVECALFPPDSTPAAASTNATLSTSTETCNTIQQLIQLRQGYLNDQLQDQGLLLMITLSISCLIAWVTVRKHTD